MATHGKAGLLVRDEAPQTTVEAVARPVVNAAPRQFRTRIQKTNAAGPSGEIAAARRWVRNSASPDESAWATFYLGIVLQRYRQYREAEQRLREAHDSGHPTVALAAAAILGLLSERRGQRAQAKAKFEEVLASKHPQLAPMAAAELGSILSEQEDWAKAEEYLRMAVGSRDRDKAAGAALELGLLLLKRGRDAEAVQVYRKALKSNDPKIVRTAANNLGALLTDRGRYRRAIVLLKRAADAGSALATFNLGALHLWRGDRDAAERYFRSALGSEDPVAASAAATRLGIILLEVDETEAAEPMLRRAIKTRHPDTALAILSLGVLFTMGFRRYGTFPTPPLSGSPSGTQPAARDTRCPQLATA
jgi:tetratricopeptide (TPR) repeat protein